MTTSAKNIRFEKYNNTANAINNFFNIALTTGVDFNYDETIAKVAEKYKLNKDLLCDFIYGFLTYEELKAKLNEAA